MITFHARDQLVSTIEKIEGQRAHAESTPPNRTVKDAVVRHCDDDGPPGGRRPAPCSEKRNVFFPAATTG